MVKFLSAVLFSFSLASVGLGYGGGEDFPFRCEAVDDVEIATFEVRPDFDSMSGYKVVYETHLGTEGEMEVEITETEDRRHFVIQGSAIAPAVIFARHIKAVIAKNPSDSSAVSFKLTFPGFKPIFSATLRDARCFAY